MMAKVLGRIIILVALILANEVIYGQIQHGGVPQSVVFFKSARTCSVYNTGGYMAPKSAVLSTRGIRNKSLVFAHPFDVNLSPANAGVWGSTQNGKIAWRLTIVSQGAKSTGLIFSRYNLPASAGLFLYTPDGRTVLGAFTGANNKVSGKLPTMPLPGDSVVVQLEVDEQELPLVDLEIGRIAHDFTGVLPLLKNAASTGDFGSSERCEINQSRKPEYDKIARSVVKIINEGVELCSGTLLNNTALDGKPYVLSASHAFRDHNNDASTSLYIFNYAVPMDMSSIEGSREQSVAGGITRSYSKQTGTTFLDFFLSEMSVLPPESYMATYAGWNLSSASPKDILCIHHPSGDVRKISFDYDSLPRKSLPFNGPFSFPSGYWQVDKWDAGVTEGGSSGSAIFNKSGQVLGGLSAGSADCNNPYDDYFFRFDLAWQATKNSNDQLKVWLDPKNSGIKSLGMYDPAAQRGIVKQSNISGIEVPDKVALPLPYHGYYAGNNSAGVTEVAEAFENSDSVLILGVYFVPVSGVRRLVNNPKLKIYSGDSGPEKLLYQQDILINEWQRTQKIGAADNGRTGGFAIKYSYTNSVNFIQFPMEIAVPKRYFVAVEFPENPLNDSLVLYQVVREKTTDLNTAWFKKNDTWDRFTNYPGKGIAASLWVEPVVKPVKVLLDTIEDLFLSQYFMVYPNPVNGSVDLTISLNPDIKEKVSGAVYDMQGRLVYSIAPTEATTLLIPKFKIPCGLLYLRLCTPSKILGVAKIVVN